MSELLEKLGVDWKLLLAQAANFLIILTVLRLTVYKPLIRVLNERRSRIEKGLKDAATASRHLGEVEAEGKKKMAQAEKESLAILSLAEDRAKTKEAELIAVAKGKEGEILKNAERMIEVKRVEAEVALYKDAVEIVRSAIAKTTNLSPNAIDRALVEEGIQAVKKVAS